MINKLILLLLIFISITGCKQDSVLLRSEIKPNKKYNQNLTITSNTEINFIADQETLEQIESNGFKLPIMTESVSKMITNIITDDPVENNVFFATKEYVEMTTTSTINGKTRKEKKPYSGITLLGKYNEQNKFEIDSIVGIKLTPQMKYFHRITIGKLEKKINFPTNNLKIGDSIINHIPITIPVQGMNAVYIMLKIDYILKEINDNTAIFSVKNIANLDEAWGQDNIELTGAGKGTAMFDIKDNYLTSYNSNLRMKLTINIDGEMTATINISTNWEQITSMD